MLLRLLVKMFTLEGNSTALLIRTFLQVHLTLAHSVVEMDFCKSIVSFFLQMPAQMRLHSAFQHLVLVPVILAAQMAFRKTGRLLLRAVVHLVEVTFGSLSIAKLIRRL